jgi:1-acyl-sn-glycerol-3-phosphate acyltransferase
VIVESETKSQLSSFESKALWLARLCNEHPRGKALQQAYYHSFSKHWVNLCTRNLLHLHGMERIQGLVPDRGVLVCANHRSFFDQYMVVLALLQHTDLVHELYFPIRSNFFYETWSGVLVNALIGGMAMYPPIFRDPAKAEHNREGLDKIAGWLTRPGVVVGMHPEGTRGKGPDPYELLPAQPGVGQVIMRSHPVVLPIFINGLSNDFVGQIASNFRTGERRGTPIHIVFGAPVDFGDLLAGRARPAQYKRVADHVAETIRKLGQEERVLRASDVPSPDIATG